MIFPRAVPPVYSPVRPLSLARAALRAVLHRDEVQDDASSAIARHFGRGVVALTDSGTSALVMALRIAAAGAPVAMPGYACIDLIAAARFAGMPVMLYDLDPRTLSPDLDSLGDALGLGARSVVVVHLFGYPVELSAVRAVTNAHGAVLIEDAAQGIGGSYAGTPLGAHGDLSVLSFGRGKGANAAGGGALLASPDWTDRARKFALAPGRAGPDWPSLVAGTAQWALGRPSLYAMPLAMPSLRLGEMIFKAAHEPRALSSTSASLVGEALASGAAASTGRRAVAQRLGARVSAAGAGVAHASASGQAGALRLPVLLPAGTPNAPRLGALRPYPIALADHEASVGTVISTSTSPPGCRELARQLFTLPTHEQVEAQDEARLAQWVLERRA